MRRIAFFAAVALLAACRPQAPATAPKVEAAAPRRTLASSDVPVLVVGDGTTTARILLDRSTVGLAEGALTEVSMQAGAKLPLHVHPRATEILFMLQGEGELSTSGQTDHVAAGNVLLIPSGVVHGFTAGTAVLGAQFYVPGGPEQRFRGQPTTETVKPEESDVPDGRDAKILSFEGAPLRVREDGRQYRFLIEGVQTQGRKIDLLWVKVPANRPADLHSHDDVSELVYVLAGEGTANIGDQAYPVGAGSGYWTPRGFQAGLATKTEMQILILVVT